MGRAGRCPDRDGAGVTEKRPDLSAFRLETRLAHAGRDAKRSEGAVNPPIQRATTLILEDADDLYDSPAKTYALQGMATQDALKEALVAVEGGAGATLAPSGLAACALAILSVARAGGEVLVTDSVYRPTRRFCDRMLKRLGMRVRYYPPRIGAGIAGLMTDETFAVYMESPGSLTFEVQDVSAIAAAAHARGAAAILDNTWSAGALFKPFKHGVDLSVQALTKYQLGHADAFLGAVLAATPEFAHRTQAAYSELGYGISPDDAYLVLRGMRTLAVRLDRQGETSLKVANWLATRPEVSRILHPALSSHPDHALWARDFNGPAGLFAFELRETAPQKLKAMLESMRVFAMGFSWGGYESLLVPTSPQIVRTAEPWKGEGTLMRASIGLEHADDLIADLDQAFARLR